MSEIGQHPARVGVRELRQNLSVYLDRVKDGETLVVTEHGQSVAHLAPLPAEQISIVGRLIADGRARPAKGDLLARLPLQLEVEPGRPLSEILLEMRDEEAS